ncbi:MAG: response regulator [Lachnospirales bacterium]
MRNSKNSDLNPLHLNILIAEDEPIILKNIAKKVKQSSCTVTVETAESGREALEFLQNNDFDILITDIEMPKMSGLELIEKVKSEFPKIKIIILSSHDNFEYARSALRNNIEDYLLKPISLETINNVLQKLSGKIYEEKYRQNREILYTALNNTTPVDMPPNLLENGTFYLIHFTIGNLSNLFTTPVLSHENFNIWDNIDFFGFTSTLSNVQHIWVINETYAMQKFIILQVNDKITPEFLKLAFKNYFCNRLNYPFFVTIYPKLISYQDIWNSAKFLREITKQQALPFMQKVLVASKDLKINVMDSHTQKENIKTLLSICNSSEYLSYVKNVVAEYINKNYSTETTSFFVYEAFMAMPSVFQIDIGTVQDAVIKLFNDFFSYKNYDEFMKHIEIHMNELLSSQTMETDLVALSTKIQKYIDNNFTHKISLNDISEHFNYTPSYINRVFKKEFNISPLQYIINLKLEYAKKLMLNSPDLNIKTIAFATGYDDARYFSRIFKNEVGLTPSQWLTENTKTT